MTDEQVEKALELCVSPEGDCCALGCPYAVFLKTRSCKLCIDILAGDALALIKRQREEKEEILGTLKNLTYDYRELEASVKFHKAEIRAEAIREFAERLDGYLTVTCTIEKNAVKSSIADDDTYFHGGKEIAFADVKQRIISILQEMTEEQK